MKNKQTKTWPALTIGNYNSFDDNYRFFERLIRIYNENIKHNIDCGALHNERIEILFGKNSSVQANLIRLILWAVRCQYGPIYDLSPLITAMVWNFYPFIMLVWFLKH